MVNKIVESIRQGRGMVGVSLPVRIFEPRSLLERVCDGWTSFVNPLNDCV